MSEFFDIQEVYDEMMTLYGINPSGKTTVELPCELVGKIATLLERELKRRQIPDAKEIMDYQNTSNFGSDFLWTTTFETYSWQTKEPLILIKGTVIHRQKDIFDACEQVNKLIEKIGLDTVTITSCRCETENGAMK